MSYQIINPVKSLIIGWHSVKKARFGGYVIRRASQYDKDLFGCTFRVCSPYQDEHVTNEAGEVQLNPLFWSRPAKAYENGIMVYESDENEAAGKWYKWRGQLDLWNEEKIERNNRK